MVFFTTILGVLLGIGLSLIPGLHVNLGLALLVSIGIDKVAGPLPTACMLAAAAGASLYMHRLSSVYHPAAGGGEIATLDHTLRFTALGRGPDALRILQRASDIAWVPFVALTFIFMVCYAANLNLAKALDTGLGFLGIPLIVIWGLYTCSRSRNPLMTLLGFFAVGMFGYVTLHHPAMRGNEHGLAPIMTGLFGIPIMLSVLSERSNGLVPQRLSRTIAINPFLGLLGSGLGAATGFFAGLGSSSVAGLAGAVCDDDNDYLMLVGSSEATNNIISVLLVLLAGMGRSGEAVLIGRVCPYTALNFMAILTILGALAIGAFAGRSFMLKLENWYIKTIGSQPQSNWALLVIGLGLFQVLLTGQIIVGLGLTACGVALSLWCRSSKLPLQVSFSALAFPLIIQQMGLVPFVNGVLFW